MPVQPVDDLKHDELPTEVALMLAATLVAVFLYHNKNLSVFQRAPGSPVIMDSSIKLWP